MTLKLTTLAVLALALGVVTCQQQSHRPLTVADGIEDLLSGSKLNRKGIRDGVSFLIDKIWNLMNSRRKSRSSLSQLKNSDGGNRRQSFGGVTGDLNQRIRNVRFELKECIAPAIASVEADIASDNADKVILALTNFLGAFFGSLKVISEAEGSLDTGDRVLLISQLMYGYGYVTPFALEYENPTLTCGLPDLQAVEPDYAFIEFNSDVNPAIKKYFLTEQANRYNKALYCITSRKGSNSDANKLSSLIDLHKSLQEERL